VTREEIATRKQCSRDDSSSLRKRREVMVKIMNRREIEEIQKKSVRDQHRASQYECHLTRR